MRRKGREREVILIEHLLCALDPAGHIPTLFSCSSLQGSALRRQVGKGEIACCESHGYVCRAKVQTWVSLISEQMLFHYIHLVGF